jgi:TetR/AcrR family transcriptional repressor of nem operon
MTAKFEQKERSHESILDSAARLVRERGISGARVADVMNGAALTVGAFYAHFSSKDALIDEALRRTARALRNRLFAHIEEKPEADRAEVILKRYLSADHRDSASLGCPLPAVAGEVGTSARQHEPVVAEHLEMLVEGLAEHLPAGGPVPRRALAIGLMALMYGGLTLARAVRGSGLSDEILRACRTVGAAAARRKDYRT